MLEKQSILQIKNVYTAHAFGSGGECYVGAGSETEPVVQLYNLATKEIQQPDQCPGGMMSFIPVPGEPLSMVTIMGLFPPFVGMEAGLFLHRKGSSGWKTHKTIDLPFAHRCEFLPGSKSPMLIAATVSKFKAEPSDWSRPGEIHAICLDNQTADNWSSRVVDASITRNHGMFKGAIDGAERLCVSGQEGIFSIAETDNEEWELERIFGNEVSEMTFIDLDGDGQTELITIEPFHGHTLNIYKRMEGEWKLKFTDSLSFGHGLSSGMFNGEPVIVAGSRRDSLALELFTVDNLDKGAVNRRVIEEEAGPTQTQVFAYNNKDYILSANQRKHEVALYTGSLTS